MRDLIEQLCTRNDLSREAMRDVFTRVIHGHVNEVELTALLVALKAKGETPQEIAGAAESMRAAARPMDTAGIEVADTCGTGGDGLATVNVSTAVALIAAEMGIAIAKHGNRSVSSQCGSADVLERCGLKIDVSPEASRRCLQQLRICFLFAPQYHAGMRHAVPVRRALATRTIFNLVGPLANPARPSWQLVGVYDQALCTPMAKTLALLGCRAALVVHGAGLDEIALHAPTTAAVLRDGAVEPLQIEPQTLGLEPQPVEALRGGDAAHNAALLRDLLAGEAPKAHAQAVALNAGALLWIAGRFDDLREAVEAASETIAGGGAASRLQRWAELSWELSRGSA